MEEENRTKRNTTSRNSEKAPKRSNTKKKAKRKNKENIRLKEFTIRLVLVLILIAIIVIAVGYVTNLNTNKIEEHTFYQYLGGQKNIYDATLEITQKQDITQLICKDIEIELDSTPIYYEDIINKVLFPETMSIVYPMDNGKMRKIPRFSTCTRIGESIYIENSNNKVTAQNAFLYDGGNLYFFLQNTTVTIGEDIYTLGPLSYMNVVYNQETEIYNKRTDTYEMVNTQGKEVIAKTDDYEINLNTDTIKCSGREQILLKRIDILEKIDWE